MTADFYSKLIRDDDVDFSDLDKFEKKAKSDEGITYEECCKIFGAEGDWSWKGIMYNSKFRSDKDANGNSYWSNVSKFSTAVNSVQDVDDNGYSAVKVAVRYAGPVSVLSKCGDTTVTNGTVRVQAFATADFCGEPIAEVITTERASIIDLCKLESNARLVGLPADGTCYVCAYIDMNGNRVRDAWEPWGYAKEGISFKGAAVAPEVGLFIEDADTDNDLIPDAYEYAKAGWTGDFDDIKDQMSSSVDKNGQILFSSQFAAFTNGLANISTGLKGATLTTLMNGSFTNLLDFTTSKMSVRDMRSVVSTNTTDNKVVVSFVTLNEGRLFVTTDEKVMGGIAGMSIRETWNHLTRPSVTFRIYRKSTLLDAEWTFVQDVTCPYSGLLNNQINLTVSGVDFSSGIYKVELVPAQW